MPRRPFFNSCLQPAVSEEKKPFHSPFAALAALREGLPQGKAPKEKAQVLSPVSPPRAVVRLERAGRKGKEVTVISHLELPRALRETWLGQLKAALGCGGALEEDALVLQGDQRDRAAQWLTARGVKKITLG